MRLVTLALALTCLSLNAYAITVSGIAYDWLTIEPLPNVIIRVSANDSQILQRVSDDNGSYTFELPPGRYAIEGIYFENGTSIYYTLENLTLTGTQNDTFFDLIMFPPTESLFPLIEDEIQELGEEIISEDLLPKEDDTPIYLLILLLFIAIAVLSYFFYMQQKKETRIVGEVKVISNELYDVVDIIKQRGGRIAQRELQKELDVSAAKMSMIVNELETKGVVKRIKKGRGNILALNQ